MKHFVWITLVLWVTAGCQQQPHVDRTGEEFRADNEMSASDKFAEREIAAGARHDGTLYACHFDSDRVNALGRAKLDAMLKADRISEPLVVYVAAPNAEDKKPFLLAYLKDMGVSEARLLVGENPDANFAAAPQIKALAKTESGDTDESGAAGGAPAAAGAGALGAVVGALTNK
jgi:hypothetical protein